MASNDISISGVFTRIALSLVLVIGTFNPTGYSLAHWITEGPTVITPGKVVAILGLLIAWLMCLRTAFIALGKFGVLLSIALFGAVIWLLVDQNLLSLQGTAFVWAVLVIIALLLGIGLSWGLLRARATGQIEVR